MVGRERELSVLDDALRCAHLGEGSVFFLVAEPGLGKTRLVQECRNRFMAWVGARTGRLPLWLEGRCASYASSTPYGLYQQLLSAWIGVSRKKGRGRGRRHSARAIKALLAGDVDHVTFLAHLMGLRPPTGPMPLDRLSPEGCKGRLSPL